MFASCSAATTFRVCFDGCKNIEELPENMFDGCIAVTNFYQTFHSCSTVTEIPSGIFTDCTEVTTFFGCFEKCTGITYLTNSNLFAKNTKVTTFTDCFNGCTSLIGISSALFNKCTLVESFNGTSEDCEKFKGDEDLNGTGKLSAEVFKYCTAVENFNSCFRECAALSVIPKNLFRSNTSITDLGYCFYGVKEGNTDELILYIGSKNVSSATDFYFRSSSGGYAEQEFAVYVIEDSTTYETFNSYGSYCTVEAISEDGMNNY